MRRWRRRPPAEGSRPAWGGRRKEARPWAQGGEVEGAGRRGDGRKTSASQWAGEGEASGIADRSVSVVFGPRRRSDLEI
jgi:hypothetical protein